jgi:hypothetical protein
MARMLFNKNGLFHFFVVLVYIATTFASPVDIVRDDTDVTRHKFLNDATLEGIDNMLKKREEEIDNLDASILDNK